MVTDRKRLEIQGYEIGFLCMQSGLSLSDGDIPKELNVELLLFN